MADTLDVGVEIPSPELAGLLGAQLGTLPGDLDATGASYVLVGADRADGVLPSPSPTVVGTLLARRSRRIGIVVAFSPQRDHPYNAARRAASLDHASGGRAGLLGLARDTATALGVADGSTWAPGPLGPAELADALLAARTLWRTWPIETLSQGPEAFEHPVYYADHVGVFSTRGPLNSPTTPQGEPVVFWRVRATEPSAVVSEVRTASAVADVVVVDAGLLDALDPAERDALAGTGVRLHARVRVPVDELRTEITRLAAAQDLSGVTLVLPAAELGVLGGDLLPELRAAGLVAASTGPDAPTLRARLGIPRRTEPDLSTHATAFPPVSHGQKESA